MQTRSVLCLPNRLTDWLAVAYLGCPTEAPFIACEYQMWHTWWPDGLHYIIGLIRADAFHQSNSQTHNFGATGFNIINHRLTNEPTTASSFTEPPQLLNWSSISSSPKPHMWILLPTRVAASPHSTGPNRVWVIGFRSLDAYLQFQVARLHLQPFTLIN